MTTIRKICGLRLPLMVMILMLALSITPAMVSADEIGDEGDVGADVMGVEGDGDRDRDRDRYGDDEESTFQNTSQALRTQRVADAAALNSDDPELGKAVDNYEEARDARRDARATLDGLLDAEEPDEAAIVDAREALRQARQDVREARADVAEELSRVSGETADEIEARRAAGEGWGDIIKDLGLHPSIAGHRFGQLKDDQPTVRSRHRNRFGDDGDFSATARDVKNAGWGKGHGMSVSGKGHGNGKAGSFDSDDDGFGKAKGKSNGQGVGKSNSGGNGKGGGNGNGKK